MAIEDTASPPEGAPDGYHPNGTGGNEARPKVLADGNPLLVAHQGQGRGAEKNIGEPLITGSDDPTDYLPLGRMTEASIARTTRMTARLNQETLGITNVQAVFVWKFNAQIGKNGEARKEFIKINVAHRSNEDRKKKGFNGAGDRYHDMNKNDLAS